MKPSAEQMMEAAQQALRTLVAPNVNDQWAASALRSVDVILSHLRARTGTEGPMLFEDNKDLADLLSFVPPGLLGQDAAIAAALRAFLGEAEAVLVGYPAVAALADLNDRGRAVVDDLLLLCHRRQEDPETGRYHERLRAYLMRHLNRETPFFFPTFVGRPV
jgi:hypothetical protein